MSFRHEASYADCYSDVWLSANGANELGKAEFGIAGTGSGIDLACIKPKG